ncbi:MFS transporter [Streptomyces verrucosisporus]|uniref:MFS transporter n=1 Tax=Streptomyces verrucosisporus TaxID=1695161 RepID=UPI0019D21202|nr:MFS transporter [Streptomyces verrucosisporus]MBN3928270.1 MFS transporter [Streptomyces verrucosisporus]
MSTGPGTGSAPTPDVRDRCGPPAPRARLLSSLKVRNYRLFFLGQVVSNNGTWTQRIAQDWLVLSLTGSSTAVGITTALQFLPLLLFGLYGGVLVDRLPKRPVLAATQVVMALTALALAALTLTGRVHVWHVYAAAFAVGLATVFDNPARQSFLAELVGPSLLRNAVGLNSANFQSARLIGPAIAGLLITGVGTGWAFLLNGVSFAAPLTCMMLMRNRELRAVERAPRGKGQLREGLRYVAGRPELLWPIVLVGFFGTFALNFPVHLSAYADDVFDAGAGAYSLFNTLVAAGSLAGALLTARHESARRRLPFLAALAFGVLQTVAAAAPTLWSFALLMVPMGLFAMVVNVATNATMQTSTAVTVRGRVTALYMMVLLGGAPLGAPVVGWITDTYGARAGLAAAGAVATGTAAVTGFLLLRAGDHRIAVGWRRRRPWIRIVPREPGKSGG